MLTDEQLWADFQADGSAWAALLARHWANVLAYVAYRVGDKTRARLIVREVFRRIYRHREHTPAGFMAWAYSLAHKLSEPHWSEAFKAECAEADRVFALIDAWEAEHGPASIDDLRRLCETKKAPDSL